MAVRASVQVTINDPSAQIAERVVTGLNLAAERGLALSMHGVPMSNVGTLAGSGTVEPAKTIEDDALVVFDTPYAARLHEHPEYNFSKDANPNAQGKWVEEAMLQGKDELGAIVRKQTRGGGPA